MAGKDGPFDLDDLDSQIQSLNDRIEQRILDVEHRANLLQAFINNSIPDQINLGENSVQVGEPQTLRNLAEGASSSNHESSQENNHDSKKGTNGEDVKPNTKDLHESEEDCGETNKTNAQSNAELQNKSQVDYDMVVHHPQCKEEERQICFHCYKDGYVYDENDSTLSINVRYLIRKTGMDNSNDGQESYLTEDKLINWEKLKEILPGKEISD